MSSVTKNSRLPKVKHIPLRKNQPLSDLKSRASGRELVGNFFKASCAMVMPNKGMNLVPCGLERLGCARSDVIEPRVTGSVGRELQKNRKKQRDPKAKHKRVVNNTRMSPLIVDACCVPGIIFTSDAYLVDCVVPSRSRVKQTENVVFQFCPLFEESFTTEQDQFSAWRLNIEDMSYEDLLDLSDKIGYESIGLKKNEMLRCLAKAEHQMQESIPLLIDIGGTWICSICQEGDDAGGEKGRLVCGHSYHTQCIKLWLEQRNSCPVCKTAATDSQ